MAATIKVATLVTELVAEADGFAKGLQGSIGSANSWASKIKSVVGAAAKFIAGAAVAMGAAIVGAGVALGKLAMDAAPLEGIGIAFEKMSTRVGLSLDSLRTAAAGTISDFELMRQANVALTGAGEQLGVAFGQALPGLLEAARAAARATGQDVDFLFQSLVSGVKRSSPMLIDNTGLVIKLGEANQAMADQLGKSVSELTAEEKQIALLNATLAAGERLTAEFGGGQLTAAEKMAQFKASVQNTKDQIGLALLPVLSTVMDVIQEAAAKYLPDIIEAFTILGEVIMAFLGGAPGDYPWEDVLPPKLADIAYKIASAFEQFIGVVRSGQGIFAAVMEVLDDFLPEETIDKIWNFRDAVVTAFQNAVGWVQTNWPIFRDTIIGVFNTIKGWVETNWPTIRDTIVTAFQAVATAWEESIKPALSELVAWLQVNVPIAIAALVAFWNDTLLPAFETVRAFISDNLIPILAGLGAIVLTVVVAAFISWAAAAASAAIATLAAMAPIVIAVAAVGLAVGLLVTAWQNNWLGIQTTLTDVWNNALLPAFEAIKEWLEVNIPLAIEALKTFWTDVLLPAIQDVWAFIQNDLVPLFEALATLLEVTVGLAVTVLAGFWQNVLQPALASVWGFINDSLIPIFEDIASTITDTLKPILTDLAEKILPPIGSAFDNISGAIQTVIGWIQGLIDKIKAVEIPDWLKPGSPPPLALALDDIAAGMRNIAKQAIPELAMAFSGIASPVGLMATGAAMETNYNYSMNVSTRATTPTVVQDFRTLAALSGA